MLEGAALHQLPFFFFNDKYMLETNYSPTETFSPHPTTVSCMNSTECFCVTLIWNPYKLICS